MSHGFVNVKCWGRESRQEFRLIWQDAERLDDGRYHASPTAKFADLWPRWTTPLDYKSAAAASEYRLRQSVNCSKIKPGQNPEGLRDDASLSGSLSRLRCPS